MERFLIGSGWNRDNRNGLNRNFEYLFQTLKKISVLSDKADTAIEEAQRINAENTNTNERLDNIIADSGTSSTEVVDARGNHTVLSNRLNKTDDKLKDTSTHLNREIIARKQTKPLITIIDDDGRSEFLNNWGPILDEKNFKIDIAVITDWVGDNNFMTWEELENLKSEGKVDLVNHTHNHPQLANLATEEEIELEFEESVRILQERGHHYDIMIYPGGSHDERVRRITRKYCRAGIHILGDLNTSPIDTFRMSRANLMPNTGEMGTIESYTALIDQAVEENAWLIFVTHSQYQSFDAEKVKAVIDYANSSDIEWVNTREGLDYYGNIIDSGDYTARNSGAEYTILDANGVLHSKTNEKQFVYENEDAIDINTPISYFPKNKLTVTDIDLLSSSGFPSNTAGTLLTFRGKSYAFEFQIYYFYNDNVVWRRTWNRDTDGWNDFEKISIKQSEIDDKIVTLKKPFNHLPESAPITEFESDKITVFIVNGSEPYNGKSGIVTTWRVNGNGWDRQELRVYQSNEVYSRYVMSDGSWSAWEKISAV